MTRRQIEELLGQQADRMSAGQTLPGQAAEPASVERAGLSAAEQRSLSGLLHLARRVQAVLVQVEPRPSFVAELKSRLVARRRAEARPAANGRRGLMWVWGIAGALSLAGLGFLGYRAVAASRNARPALPKA
jgi:hypothetical protein